jgi:predicted RNA polymerase sigma factor
MSKRLVRAKDKIRQAGISFTVPEREELPARLETVLDAMYAAFAGAWTDPGAFILPSITSGSSNL